MVKKNTMKNLIKISSYILATTFVFVMSMTSSFAADGNTNTGSSLTAIQVVLGLAVLLLVILLPLMGDKKKTSTQSSTHQI
jgi:hypothetical protein